MNRRHLSSFRVRPRALAWVLVMGPLGLLSTACPRGEAPGAHDPHGDQAAADPPGEPAAHDDHAEHEDHAEHADPHAEPGMLHVEPTMMRDLRVTTRAAAARPAGESVTVLGELRVNEDAYAEVGTSTPARIVRVLAAPGDVVTEGQPLVELESAEVGRARAAVATTRARLELARASATRRRTLSDGEVVPQRVREEAEAELAAAEAEHRGARDALAALGATRGAGARFVLTAPVAGTVLERSALRGALVDAERPLFVVADLRTLWLVVHAFERDALRMRPGASARVSFLALPGQASVATVARVGSRVDEASRTIDVRLDVDNPERTLRPGMAASALVPVGGETDTVVTVPVESLQRQPEGWVVFLPGDEPGSFHIRPVGRGRDLGGEVELLSGLEAGERVVVEGAFLLKAEADKARGGGEEHHH